MKIATWNVNSVRSRITHLTGYLKNQQPDIVMLQELKCLDEQFPAMEIEGLGYNLAIFGQKSYNGVAILSRYPIEDITTGFKKDSYSEPEKWQNDARYIECVVSVEDQVFRVASVYVPNGNQINSDKWQYKLEFLNNLKEHLSDLLKYKENIIIGGDYNIAPQDIDVYNPKELANTICFHPAEQKIYRQILNSGYTDAYRLLNPSEQCFSWWDYRGGSYNYNKGMRIDHLLLSANIVDKLEKCYTDTKPRELKTPSDHAPVVCLLYTSPSPRDLSTSRMPSSA